MTINSTYDDSTTFKVVLKGIRDDIPIETTRTAFAGLLRTTPEKVNRLFSSFPYVLKKLTSAELASRYKSAIDKAGGICTIEVETSLVAASAADVPLISQLDLTQLAAPPASEPVAKTTPVAEEKIPASQPTSQERPASLFQKAVRAAKRFLLLDIPKRSIPLKFALPSPSARAKVGSGSSAEFHEFQDDPLEYFKLLHARVKFLNFAKLGADARLSATRDLLKMYYPRAMKQVVELAKTGGIPESSERRQLLILTGDIANILIISCAFVFADYYEGSKLRYARNRKQVLELASRIFELMLLKQRARALRYQLLDAADWSIANTVFHVMRAYEDVNQPMSTLIMELKMDGARVHKSLSDQFTLLQIYAWFDMLRLPTRLQWVIGSYLLKVENATQIKADTGPLGPNEVLVYCYGKQPAETRRLGAPPGPALVLNLDKLIDAMREDCMSTGHANQRADSDVVPRLANFDAADFYVIRNQLLSRLNPEQEHSASGAEQRVDDLRIFVGLVAVYNMLRHRQGAFGAEDRLEDSLSKRSAVFATDGNETRKTLWSFAFQSESMTRFTTTEGVETTAMGIGMLLAYGAGDEVNRPRLAVVSRILRPHGKIVELDMRFIASFCEPVVLSFNSVKAPGLILFDPRKGGRWALAFPPREVLIGVDSIEIHRNKTVTVVEPTGILDASSDFYLLETPLTSSQLGFSSAPKYPPPQPKAREMRIF